MKTFIGISSFQVLAVFRRGLFYSYLTIYLRHFLGLSVTATTLFATLPMIANVLAQRYIWGDLSDRSRKRRSLIILGEAIGGAGTIALFYCHRIPADRIFAGWIIIAGMTLIEIFWSMSNIGWSALISDIYKEGDRSSVMGWLESMGGMGRISGVLSGGLLYDRMGSAFEGWGFYEGALFWVSGIVMFISILPMLLVPEGGLPEKRILPAEKGEGRGVEKGAFFIFIGAMTLIHFGRNAIAVTLPQYLSLESGLNLSPLNLSHIVNIRSLGVIATGLLAGFLCRSLGDRAVLSISSLVAALALFIQGLFTGIGWICTASFLMGVSEVLIIASSYELASAYIPPEKRGRYFAIFNATFFLSWGVGATLIAGPVTDYLMAAGTPPSPAYMISFNVCGFITLAGGLILFPLYAFERRKAFRQS